MKGIVVALIAGGLLVPAVAPAQEPQKTEKGAKKKTVKKNPSKKKAGEPKAG